MSQIFGPVPSRRLGFSLGIDPIPFKTCTLDCIYCQLGRTTHKTVERKEYVHSNQILKELEKFLKEKKKIDYITFSGSGEPTLNSNIRKMITEIKKMTSIPIAILTNGTLLSHSQVREDLLEADLVIPSLDAISEKVFKEVNRPHPLLKIDEVISGIINFSKEFKGKIWLEIMLVKRINDSLKEMRKVAEIIKEMKLNKIQLNTVIRPPAENFAQALNIKDLERIRGILGKEKCEIIAKFEGNRQKAYKKDIEEEILRTLKRRPLTVEDLSSFLGLHQNEVIKYITVLEEKEKIKSQFHRGQRYYEKILEN
ncbi:radical SAM protein [Candidatus Aerophobetes bacterium]|nr:radical SAM protein [Candidatus Aerophobetes bacterium]